LAVGYPDDLLAPFGFDRHGVARVDSLLSALPGDGFDFEIETQPADRQRQRFADVRASLGRITPLGRPGLFVDEYRIVDARLVNFKFLPVNPFGGDMKLGVAVDGGELANPPILPIQMGVEFYRDLHAD
jgi:hypothetical protein